MRFHWEMKVIPSAAGTLIMFSEQKVSDWYHKQEWGEKSASETDQRRAKQEEEGRGMPPRSSNKQREVEHSKETGNRQLGTKLHFFRMRVLFNKGKKLLEDRAARLH